MIPQHQQGIGLDPVSDSGITCVVLGLRGVHYLRTMERDLMRPVPVVFLLLA